MRTYFSWPIKFFCFWFCFCIIPSPVTAGDQVPLIRIGAWNIKKLGHGSSKDYGRVAAIIASEFDILAVVEVMQKQRGHPGLDRLHAAMGPGWEAMVTPSPRPATSAGHAEFYAILYNSSVIRPCEGFDELTFHMDNDGSPDGSGEDLFSREPAYGCFEVPLTDGSIGVDFLIAAYHARWAGGNKGAIAGEVGHITDVFRAMATAKPGEFDLFIAGDFNLVPAALSRATSRSVDTQGNGSTLNTHGELTSNVYDHFLVWDSAASSELVGAPAIIDVRGEESSNRDFFKTVSDHLPVRAYLRAEGPDDD